MKFDGAIGPETELKATQTGGCWAAGRDKLKLGGTSVKVKCWARPEPMGRGKFQLSRRYAGRWASTNFVALPFVPFSPIPVRSSRIREERKALCTECLVACLFAQAGGT